MSAYIDSLPVLYDRIPIGNLVVSKRTQRKIIGKFTPGTGFEVCREAFANASRWAQRFADSHAEASLDYPAFDNYVAAIQSITLKIELPGLSQSIEEFAIDHLSDVEVTLTGVVE
jgi:hypothetical protein